ncbi:hypothetical protein GIB67_006179 [Kingdonia uniflora]|uniref:Nicastrin n=1 Tax=Kingdonia uniflora TaxID=39325 RepID=A0A7J7LPY1_9MAGN|nr:hypothetical protein GIB67_006179 [Kingdonia uniflora]
MLAPSYHTEWDQRRWMQNPSLTACVTMSSPSDVYLTLPSRAGCTRSSSAANSPSYTSSTSSTSTSGKINSLESVPDLEMSMYMNVDGYPCVRLLNLSGEIGCANPSRDKVVAPVVRFKNLHEPVHPSTILVSLDEMESLFTRHAILLIYFL